MLVHMGSLLVLALAVSLDGFGVGVTYGLRGIRLPVISVAIIAICSGMVIGLSMLAGGWLSAYLPAAAARVIGAAILIAIGMWALWQLRRSRRGRDGLQHADAGDCTADDRGGREDVRESSGPHAVLYIELKRLGLVIQILRTPQAADVDRSGTISASEAVLLGVALSLDALGAGIGAAMVGFPPLLTAVLIAAASGGFLLAGMRFGLRFAGWTGMRAVSVLPGLILIVMGITRLLE